MDNFELPILFDEGDNEDGVVVECVPEGGVYHTCTLCCGYVPWSMVIGQS